MANREANTAEASTNKDIVIANNVTSNHDEVTGISRVIALNSREGTGTITNIGTATIDSFEE